jgi:hypothetical protein
MSELDEIQRLWAEQTTTRLEVDMTKILVEARRFERDVRLREQVEIGTVAALALLFGGFACVIDHGFARAGALGVVMGAVWVAVMLRRSGGGAPLPSDGETAAFVLAYRAALLRKARLLAWAPIWYVLPLLLPTVLFVAGLRAQLGGAAEVPPITLLILGALGAATSAKNLLAAARLRREAARLA